MGSLLSLSAASGSRPLWWDPAQMKKMGHAQPSLHPITTAAFLHLGFHLRSSSKKLSHLCDVPRLRDIWCEKVSQLEGINFLLLSNDVFASACSTSLSFFCGGETGKGAEKNGLPQSETSSRKSPNGRQWTNMLLAINVVAFAAQIATRGKVLQWGAKINSMIDKGQFWRLATSSLLHVNVAHLMVNCYSLNSIGPIIESLSGPRRLLAVYFTSAIASSATSYWFSKAPAVGASGAICGLVGSLSMFLIRHRGMIRHGKEDLQRIAGTIFLNMVIGLLSKGIDNWGHLGGLLGGVAVSWLVGPAWKYESLSNDGPRNFVDRAPIKYLVNRKREPGQPT